MTAIPPRLADPLRALTVPFSDAQFAVIAEYAHRNFGLNLTAAKKDMVYSRLIKRLRHLGLTDFASYLAVLQSDDAAAEYCELLSALTTNVTQFFREKHHFDFLRDHQLPGLIDKARAGRRVRIWSAGCSAGQEAYSIAVTVLALCPEAPRLDIKILASDIDRRMITYAKTASYPREELAAIPAPYRGLVVQTGKTFGFAADVRALISFAELNLIADWPFSGPFDAIFCRNVAIYFDAETQARLWHRFAAMIPADGHLFIGYSERVSGDAAQVMKSVGVTVYRKTTI